MAQPDEDYFDVDIRFTTEDWLDAIGNDIEQAAEELRPSEVRQLCESLMKKLTTVMSQADDDESNGEGAFEDLGYRHRRQKTS